MTTNETPVKPAINLAALAAELTEAQIAEILHLKSPTHIKGRLVNCIAVQWACHMDGALYGPDFIGVSMHAGSGFCVVNQATVAAAAAELERNMPNSAAEEAAQLRTQAAAILANAERIEAAAMESEVAK